jgi:hypothetical protein
MNKLPSAPQHDNVQNQDLVTPTEDGIDLPNMDDFLPPITPIHPPQINEQWITIENHKLTNQPSNDILSTTPMLPLEETTKNISPKEILPTDLTTTAPPTPQNYTQNPDTQDATTQTPQHQAKQSHIPHTNPQNH